MPNVNLMMMVFLFLVYVLIPLKTHKHLQNVIRSFFIAQIVFVWFEISRKFIFHMENSEIDIFMHSFS